MRVSIYTLTIRWRHGETSIDAYASAEAFSAGLLASAEDAQIEDIPANASDSDLIALITRRDHEVNTDVSEIEIDADPKVPAMPEAVYDEAAQTLTCPHCGLSGHVRAWTLIENGYARHWELETDCDDDGPVAGTVAAVKDTFGDDGDGYSLAHYNTQRDGGPECLKQSAVPDTFKFDF